MCKSMQDVKSVPTMNIHDDVELTNLNMLREMYIKANPKDKITLLPFMIKAFSVALKDYPVFNAHVGNDVDS